MKSTVDYLYKSTSIVILIITGFLSILTYDYIIEINSSLPSFRVFDLIFSGSVDKQQEIVNHWSKTPHALEKVNLAIGINYLFSLIYPMFFLLFCHILANENQRFPFIHKLGIVIGWMQPLAGIADAIENPVLLKIIYGSIENWLPLFTYCTGISKYGIALIGVTYCLVGLLITMYKKIRWRRHPEPDSLISHKPGNYDQ